VAPWPKWRWRKYGCCLEQRERHGTDERRAGRATLRVPFACHKPNPTLGGIGSYSDQILFSRDSPICYTMASRRAVQSSGAVGQEAKHSPLRLLPRLILLLIPHHDHSSLLFAVTWTERRKLSITSSFISTSVQASRQIGVHWEPARFSITPTHIWRKRKRDCNRASGQHSKYNL
jgi:hypothetical protein